MSLALDHVTTYIDAEDVLEQLETYRQAGFAVRDQIDRYQFGVESASIKLGAEYIELLAVPDLDQFNLAPMNDKLVCRSLRPFAVGFKAPDLEVLHRAWIEAGLELPAARTLWGENSESGERIKCRLVDIPSKKLRGANCFVVEKSIDQLDAAEPANSVYGLAAITMVSTEVAERVGQWQRMLSPVTNAASRRESTIAIGCHQVRWLDPARFRRHFKRDWILADHPFGEIAAIHLLGDDVDRAASLAAEAGFSVERGVPAIDAVLVEPDPGEGPVLAIHEWPRPDWDRCRELRSFPEDRFV